MDTLILRSLEGTWAIFVEASVYLLFGMFVAGLIAVVLPKGTISRHLGEKGLKGVVKAALFGIPLPLCSCGVIPTALGLRRQGASRGATLAFLISTPETGVDSISITYALLDPLYTIFRPVAAFATALTTGGLATLLDREDAPPSEEGADVCPVCNGDNGDGHTHSLGEKLSKAIRYGFGDLLGDIALWLVVGLVLAGLITALIPDAFFTTWIGSGIGSMVIMLAVGMPIYICATASTPVAAAMIAKGLNPGAALVFLLAGPATNAATLTVVVRYLGARSAAIYLGSIAFVSILMGLALNAAYAAAGIAPSSIVMASRELLPHGLKLAGAAVLGLLLARCLIKRVWATPLRVVRAER
ncbi:MAG: SO_0444 family Cu/Zn efflux transporter [bacterium]|nr:SO_0444 family Cu/Zn efflux transporter [bacterium]